MDDGTRWMLHSTCEVGQPQKPNTRAAVSRTAYLTISASDIQEGTHITGKISKGETPSTKTFLHRFRVLLKDLGLFLARARAVVGLGRKTSMNLLVSMNL